MTCARRFAAPLLALMAIGVVPVASAAQPGFDGVYIAHGVDAEGLEYRRAVDIERHGDRFAVTWVAAELVGRAVILVPIRVGVGIAAGDTLSVSFVAGDTLGIMVYEFSGDGQLSGRWTLAGDDETVYSETLTRLPDILPEPAAADPSEGRPRLPTALAAGTGALFSATAVNSQRPTSNFQGAVIGSGELVIGH